MQLAVREMQADDIPLIVDYWATASPHHLTAMGVDLAKLPSAEQLSQALHRQLALPVQQRISYCTIWQVNGLPVGHCNTNPTHYGHHGFLHLHLWHKEQRNGGIGLPLLQKSIDLFFETLRLQQLFSEPFAHNPAANRTLGRAGWRLEKEYITVPGSINFEQAVKRWTITCEDWEKLKAKRFA